MRSTGFSKPHSVTILLGCFVAAVFLLPTTMVAAKSLRVRKDISYVPDGRAGQSLDVYAPAEGNQLPVIVWIHGGGWRFGDKSEVDLKPRVFTEKGYLLVSINYRLHPQADFRGQAADVAAAIAWVRANIGDFAGDPERIVLMGHSAGAHLAALVTADKTYLSEHTILPQQLEGVILLDGACYDIASQIRDSPRLVASFFQLIFSNQPAVHKQASPVSHIESSDGLPPFLIIYVAARADARVQSTRLAQSLEDADAMVKLFAAHNENHATVNRDLGLPRKPFTQQVFEFLDGAADRQAGATQ